MNQDLLNQLADAEKLLAESDDAQIRQLAKEEIARLKENLDRSDPLNERGAILEIRAGSGGDEAELFAQELFRMYQRYAERQGWRVFLAELNQSSLGGIKSLVAIVEGRGAYASLRFEGGVHRVQRVPKTEKSGRIHTSAASVVVLPQVQDVDVVIRPNDLRVDVFRSGGHGGQSVNTTDSAVRLTHLPTGLVVTCQDERSQLKNKEKAMSILRSRLWEKQSADQNADQDEQRRSMIKTGDRSDKIRTYNYPQSRITDHRINKSWHNLTGTLDGDLNPLVEALRRANLGLDEHD